MPLKKFLNNPEISSSETLTYVGPKISQFQDAEHQKISSLALAACSLLPGSLTEDLQSSCPCTPGSQLLSLQTKLEESLAKLKGNQLTLQTKLEGQQESLTKMENQLQTILNKMETLQQTASKEIPPGFERIGNRYFRIVEESATWVVAERKCREMGGYLASFESEEEFAAFTKMYLKRSSWLGINDRGREGHFISVASRKPAPFLKWFKGEPNDKNHRQNCVLVYGDVMWDQNCGVQLDYICQADNEI